MRGMPNEAGTKARVSCLSQFVSQWSVCSDGTGGDTTEV